MEKKEREGKRRKVGNVECEGKEGWSEGEEGVRGRRSEGEKE